MNSAHGSCRLRSWAAPFPRRRGRRLTSRWWPSPIWHAPEKLPERGCTIYAGPAPNGAGLSDPAAIDGDSLPSEHPCPSSVVRRPRLRSLTAIALERIPRRRPQNLLLPPPRSATGEGETDYFRASVDWSTITPGPMVELSEIFCRYVPFELDGFALIRSSSS